MQLKHVLSSSRTLVAERGLKETVRYGRGRAAELVAASAALRGGPDRIARLLQAIINDRLEFDTIPVEPGDIAGCDPRVLRQFLMRSFPLLAADAFPRAATLDPLGLHLLCDVLYRTWQFRKLVTLEPLIRAHRASHYFPRSDNMLRRAAFQSGAMTLASDGLTLESASTLGDLLLRGDVWNAAGHMALANRAYEQAVLLQADNPMVRLHYGFCLLKQGKINQGLACWGMAERMFGYYPLRRPEALWRNEDLNGRSLVIVFEHGFGDMIQFARYLGPLLRRYPAARVTGLVPAPIVGLFSACFPAVSFAAVAPDGCDFHLPMTQLPNVLGTDVYQPQRYLDVSLDGTEAAGSDGARPGKLRVGICWRGHPRQYEQSRSVMIDQFAELFDIPDVTFAVLLNKVTPAERAVLDRHANVSSPAIADFLDLYRLMRGCDLIVSVDTSVVHLAGAMGKRVLLLSRPDACWRWGASNASSPWYEDVEVIRHPFDLDWPDVLAQTRARIAAAAAAVPASAATQPLRASA